MTMELFNDFNFDVVFSIIVQLNLFHVKIVFY